MGKPLPLFLLSPSFRTQILILTKIIHKIGRQQDSIFDIKIENNYANHFFTIFALTFACSVNKHWKRASNPRYSILAFNISLKLEIKML